MSRGTVSRCLTELWQMQASLCSKVAIGDWPLVNSAAVSCELSDAVDDAVALI